MNLFRLAVVLIPLAALSVVGDAAACNSDKVPTMTLDKVCLISSRTPALYSLCRYDTLKDAPPSAKVSAYALMAAAVVKRSYEATIAEGQSQRAGMNEAAVRHCVQGTTEAHARMEAVIRDMAMCDYRNIWQEYNDALALVEASGHLLAGDQLPATMVFMNDYNSLLTISARAVGALALFLTGHV